MQLWQYCLLVTARLLYMFRTLSASIINTERSTVQLITVLPLSRTVNTERSNVEPITLLQWQPTSDILTGYIYHPDPWHAPVAATTVFSTPDNGRRKRPKHLE